MRFRLAMTSILFIACADELPIVTACTDESVPAFRVDVRDSTTGRRIIPPFDIYVRDGIYVDSAKARATGDSTYSPFALAFERSGTYSVEVNAPAYQLWRVSSVQVTKDECHVQTVELVARLQS